MVLALCLGLAAAPAGAERWTVCTFGFHSPDELAVFTDRLPPGAFRRVDMTPSLLSTQNAHALRDAAGDDTLATPWLLDLCREDLTCDVVVYSAEFAGRFFGSYGASLSLQDMEEASCRPQCRGLFQTPLEVFLLACNTLATKDQDSRTPREYLEVLIDHGFDRAAAERAVALRYGPLGPSFRESLRRVFMDVPRVYGFSSVAPTGEFTAPRLHRYFQTKGDYGRWLVTAGRTPAPNRELLAAFAGTGLVQTTGLSAAEPGAADRDRICALYDEDRDLTARLRVVQHLMAREEFLAFVPTIEVFFNRHPPQLYTGEAAEIFQAIQQRDDARTEVLRMVRELPVSTIKLELAHLAHHLEWLSADDFRALAVSSAKQLLAQPLTSEVVDITCEITKHEPLNEEFTLDDLPDRLFRIPEGIRLVDCLAPVDPRVSDRLERALDDPDVVVRLWAGYVLSHRLPLDAPVLLRLAAHLQDPSGELRERLAWTFQVESPLPDEVAAAVRRHDPALADRLPAPPRGRRRGLVR